jgi:hypothetical protein
VVKTNFHIPWLSSNSKKVQHRAPHSAHQNSLSCMNIFAPSCQNFYSSIKTCQGVANYFLLDRSKISDRSTPANTLLAFTLANLNIHHSHSSCDQFMGAPPLKAYLCIPTSYTWCKWLMKQVLENRQGRGFIQCCCQLLRLYSISGRLIQYGALMEWH